MKKKLLFSLLLISTLLVSLSLPQSRIVQTKIGRGSPSGGGGGGGNFPTTGVLDNLNRTNEGPPPSANWTTGIDGSTGGFSVVSNEAHALNATLSSAYWNAAIFGPDVEVYGSIGTQIGASRLHFRIQGEGTANWDGYTVLAYTPTNEFYIYRVDNGVQAQLGGAIAQTFATGDSFGAEMIGSTITVYFCASGGACGVSGAGWTSKGARSDSTYSSAGKIAMSAFDAIGINIDNFGGGTVGSGGGGGEVDFITETFTEASDVDLTSHTPELGGAWIDHTDSAYLDPINIIGADDRIYKSSGGSGMYYNNATPSSADYCCECVMRVVSIVASNAAIAWRVDTATNTMMIFQINNGTGWRMRKVALGAQTTIGVEDTTTNIPSVGEARTMKACSAGNVHTAYINGVQLGTVGGTDSSITAAGKAGVRFSGTFTSTTGYHIESFRCFTP